MTFCSGMLWFFLSATDVPEIVGQSCDRGRGVGHRAVPALVQYMARRVASTRGEWGTTASGALGGRSHWSAVPGADALGGTPDIPAEDCAVLDSKGCRCPQQGAHWGSPALLSPTSDSSEGILPGAEMLWTGGWADAAEMFPSQFPSLSAVLALWALHRFCCCFVLIQIFLCFKET